VEQQDGDDGDGAQPVDVRAAAQRVARAAGGCRGPGLGQNGSGKDCGSSRASPDARKVAQDGSCWNGSSDQRLRADAAYLNEWL
jgi:hypothetical protein